jgi:hypothetical protein
MKKSATKNNEQMLLSGKPEHLLDRVEVFKRVCRMLEIKRKRFIENDWQHYAKLIPRQQFLHLMNVRHSLPCNLAKIMQVTGMTSAGASIFVDKMVKQGAFERHEDVGAGQLPRENHRLEAEAPRLDRRRIRKDLPRNVRRQSSRLMPNRKAAV